MSTTQTSAIPARAYSDLGAEIEAQRRIRDLHGEQHIRGGRMGIEIPVRARFEKRQVRLRHRALAGDQRTLHPDGREIGYLTDKQLGQECHGARMRTSDRRHLCDLPNALSIGAPQPLQVAPCYRVLQMLPCAS